MEPLPSINRVYFLVLQQERQLTGGSLNNSRVLSSSIENQNGWKPQGRGNGRGGSRSSHGRSNNYKSKQCAYCNKHGQTVVSVGLSIVYPLAISLRISTVNSCTVSEEGANSLETDKTLPRSIQKDTTNQPTTIHKSIHSWTSATAAKHAASLQHSKIQPHIVLQTNSHFVGESSTQQQIEKNNRKEREKVSERERICEIYELWYYSQLFSVTL